MKFTETNPAAGTSFDGDTNNDKSNVEQVVNVCTDYEITVWYKAGFTCGPGQQLYAFQGHNPAFRCGNATSPERSW